MAFCIVVPDLNRIFVPASPLSSVTLREALNVGRPRLHMSAMNDLNVSSQRSRLTLAAQGWSNWRNTHEPGLRQETVGGHLRLAALQPDEAPAGIFPRSCSKYDPGWINLEFAQTRQTELKN
jgi:hypothetical protein